MGLIKNLYICNLIDCYGELLRQNQLELLKLYYFENYSLSELAENFGVTRQAISESLNSSVEKLEKYEQKIKKVCILQLVKTIDGKNFEQIKKQILDL